MTSDSATGRDPWHARAGFSLIEAAVATLIVGGLFVAALGALSGATKASAVNVDRATGLLLAGEMMSEIVNARYVEPDDTPAFGPEPGETDGTRNAFDDVDDYDNWDASPPENPDGTGIPDRAGWRRTVEVDYADPHDLTSVVGSDQGVKRITVTVIHNLKTVARLVAVRTDGAEE